MDAQKFELERPESKQNIPKHLFDPDDHTLLPLTKIRLPHGKALYLHEETGAYIIAIEAWQEDITDILLKADETQHRLYARDEQVTEWIGRLADANLLRRTQLPGNQLCFGPNEVELIIIELTEICNLSCDYCYASAGGKTTIPIEIVRQAIETFFGSGKCSSQLNIHFTGGEPLAKFSRLLDAINCIRETATRHEVEVSFSFQTNGTLLTSRKALILAEQGVNVGVTVETFDSKSPTHRRYINGRSSVSAMTRGLKIAKQSGILYRVNITVTEGNACTLPETIFRLLKDDVRPNIVQFLPVFVGKGGLPVFETLKPNMEDLTTAAQESLQIIIDFNRQNPDNHIYEFSTAALMRKMFYERYIPEMCDQSPCGAGRQMLSLDMFGNIYPCDGFNRHPLFRCGNVFADDIETIMNAAPIRYLQQRNTLAIPACSKCVWKAYCNAGCPHDIPTNDSYSNFGQLFEKSYLCKYYTSMILYIFDLVAEGVNPYFLMPSESEFEILA